MSVAGSLMRNPPAMFRKTSLASSLNPCLLYTSIKPIAGSISFRSSNEELKFSFDKIKAHGQEYVLDYWPWYGNVPFSLEDCKKSAARLNEVGALAKNQGLRFLWHNHDNEFREMEEGLPFDYLMENTDSKLVNCEMDIYWVKKGLSLIHI